jgi:hypothetical protein
LESRILSITFEPLKQALLSPLLQIVPFESLPTYICLLFPDIVSSLLSMMSREVGVPTLL